jgi:transglutaminase-like putative cysteine protease
MPFARICLLLAMAWPFLAAAVRADSLTKDKTVVILVGLPGDMESDQAYSDQTAKLLRILNQPDRKPASVTLLQDLSSLTDFTPNYPLAKRSNDRAEFLGLADKIKDGGAAHPPVYFVFGHGGTEGTDAVFHVPGPRLTTADFATMAGASDASTWLLFFPGSSAFAGAIQGPRRVILATEAEQAYNQDPISFPLFLALFNKEPDLGKLAPQLGVATDQWYTTRTLARQEEPALWSDGQAPRKLIGEGNANPEAVATASGLAVQPATAEVPADDAWKTITPADASDYPQSDAVILSRHIAYLIDDNSQVTESEETFLQILTRAGKRFGDFEFEYTPPDEDIAFDAVEVRHADGQMEQLDDESIHDAVGNAPEGYNAPNKKIFSMPHAEPGAILHVKLQRTWKRLQEPHVFEEIPLNDQIPIAAQKVEVSVPERSALHFRFCQQAASDPVVAHTSYGSSYTWQFQNIPAAPQEPLSAYDASPILAVSTFPDWASFADWCRRIMREADTITPEITAQAQDLVKDAKTDREKIAAVTQFVTNFRYVSIPLGVNAYRPHAATNILRSRYGDCKDKANLLNTMLNSLGYKTSLVLVPRFLQAYNDLPGFGFNHAISQVQLNGQTLWIDSTDDVCRIGLLPPGDPGRNVLVINDPADKLTELPKPEAKDHRLSVKMTADFTGADDRVAQAHIEAQGQGYADYLLRYTAKEWNEKARLAPLLDGAFTPASGALAAAKQNAADVAALEQDFSWSADGTWSGLVSALPQSPVRMVRFPAWLPKEWTMALLPRTSPMLLNEGYPMQVTQTCAFKLPAGCREVKLPAPQHNDGPALAWKLSWSQPSAGEVDATLELSLLDANLDPATTQAFQSSCKQLENALQDGFSFQNPQP